MSILNTNKLYTQPRTPEHLRAALLAGQVSQSEDISDLQSQIDALSTSTDGLHFLSATFPSGSANGGLVYINGSGEAVPAQADDFSTAIVSGMANELVVAASSGEYFSYGYKELADWTSVIGSTNLTPGAEYYLSASTAGEMTETAPSTVGQVVVPLGVAHSTTVFELRIGTPVLL